MRIEEEYIMKKMVSAALAATMVVSFAACGGSQSSESTGTAGTTDSNATVVKIGGIGPTTGDNAQYGQAVKNGAEIAVEEINALGGDIQFEFKFEDDETDNEKAVNAYNVLKDWAGDDPFLVLGATTSGCTIAVGAETYADNIFQITPSGTDAKCVQYDNAFRTCFSDPNQGKISAQYIKENGLAEKVGIIYDSSDTYSSGITQAFVSEAAAQGLEVVAQEAFTADTNTDMKVQLQKLQSEGADLVFLPIYYSQASIILQQANELDYHPTFYGCDGMDGILSVENFDTSLAEGLMFLTPFVTTNEDEKTQNFVATYEEKYGQTPNQFAADSYDSVYAVYEACKKAGVTNDMDASAVCDALKTAMTEISIDGLTGSGISWGADGEPNKTPLVAKIENGAYVLM